MCVCVSVWACVMCVGRDALEAGYGYWFLRAEDTDSCVVSCGSWELKLVLLQEQKALSSDELLL